MTNSRPSFAALRRDVRAAANPARAKISASFFKTGPGEYGEGDVFLGLTVPALRVLAKRYADLRQAEISRLLASKIHEERLIALLVLVDQYDRGDARTREDIFHFYLANADRVNNWDLVDCSADKIVGRHLLTSKHPGHLPRLARSWNLWCRRIAIVATFAFIRAGRFEETFRIVVLLKEDSHDLLHKACGWMLREVGKRDKRALTEWLAPRYRTLPRTMLRYAIERFPKVERVRYLSGKA